MLNISPAGARKTKMHIYRKLLVFELAAFALNVVYKYIILRIGCFVLCFEHCNYFRFNWTGLCCWAVNLWGNIDREHNGRDGRAQSMRRQCKRCPENKSEFVFDANKLSSRLAMPMNKWLISLPLTLSLSPASAQTMVLTSFNTASCRVVGVQ